MKVTKSNHYGLLWLYPGRNKNELKRIHCLEIVVFGEGFRRSEKQKKNGIIKSSNMILVTGFRKKKRNIKLYF